MSQSPEKVDEELRVLVTGPFGNVGSNTVDELVAQGHQVRCFARKRKANEKAAKKYGGKIEVVWGDMRSPEDVARAVKDQEAIVHLAFIIPSTTSTNGISSEDRPEWAREINVGGTENLVRAAEVLPRPPKVVFASSTNVFGRTQHLPPPRTSSEPVETTNHYTGHKLWCEERLSASCLDWVILRICAVPPVDLKLGPSYFEIPRSNRVEFVHPRDAGLALANVVVCKEAVGKVLLIGGGKRCQMYFNDFLEAMDKMLNIKRLPDEAYATTPYCQDWVDTTESQRLLQFQRLGIEDYIEDIRAKLGFRRPLIRLFSPAVRWYVLRQSPYYRQNRETQRIQSAGYR